MKNTIIILLLFLFTSCFYDSTWSVELWEQKIENSNFSIYKFNASGGRDTMVSGIKIHDSTIGFKQSDVMDNDKISYLTSVPTRKKINGIYRLDRMNLQDKPFPKIKNMEINVIGYKDANGINKECSNRDFKFESFKENRDSIIFKINESKFESGNDLNKISVPKGNIYILTDSTNLKVTEIICEQVKFIKDIESSETKICIDRKYFEPINEIKLEEFTDYGIYKPIK